MKTPLASSTSYFVGLTAFSTYMPLRQDIVDKNPKAWATNVSTYISNGPFNMTDWEEKATMRFSKNTNYWNKSNIKLDTLTYYMQDQATSATVAFTTVTSKIYELDP